MAHEFMLDVIRRDIAICSLMFLSQRPDRKDVLRKNISKHYQTILSAYMLQLAYQIRSLNERYKRAKQEKYSCGIEQVWSVYPNGQRGSQDTAENITLIHACNKIIHQNPSMESRLGHSLDTADSIYSVATQPKDDELKNLPDGGVPQVITEINLQGFFVACLSFLDEIETLSNDEVKGASSLAGAGQRPADSTTNNTTTA